MSGLSLSMTVTEWLKKLRMNDLYRQTYAKVRTASVDVWREIQRFILSAL